LTVERTEQEREFYFEKLQDIEFLCQRPEFASETLTKVVERILYFTEGKPDIEAIIAECSAAQVQEEGIEAATRATSAEEEGVVDASGSMPESSEASAAQAEAEEAAVDVSTPALAALEQPPGVQEVDVKEAAVVEAPAEEVEEEVFADAEAGGTDLDTTVEADFETAAEGDHIDSMTAASPIPAAVTTPPSKSPVRHPRSPLASQPVNV
jgi:RP/EB family microtubule-associated protein